VSERKSAFVSGRERENAKLYVHITHNIHITHNYQTNHQTNKQTTHTHTHTTDTYVNSGGGRIDAISALTSSGVHKSDGDRFETRVEFTTTPLTETHTFGGLHTVHSGLTSTVAAVCVCVVKVYQCACVSERRCAHRT
jgi:hypothetical protein